MMSHVSESSVPIYEASNFITYVELSVNLVNYYTSFFEDIKDVDFPSVRNQISRIVILSTAFWIESCSVKDYIITFDPDNFGFEFEQFRVVI